MCAYRVFVFDLISVIGRLTCGGVGVEEGRPTGGVGFRLPPTPDNISSVTSLPPWLGSRMRILEDNKETYN